MIRPVRPTDAGAIQALLHAAHAWNLANGFNFTAADIDMPDLLPRLDPERFFVAEIFERLIATIEVKPEKDQTEVEPGPTWGFHLLAVAPDCGLKGVGALLVAFGETVAMKAGASRMTLDTPENHPWLPAYYAKSGYVTYDRVQWEGKHYPSILMAKDLRKNV